MKKFLVLIITILFLLKTDVIFAKSKENNDTFQYEPVILLSVDVLLLGLTTLSIIQYNSLASDYEKLYSQINGTTEANYYRLLYEKEKVNSAGELIIISGIATSLSVLYTIFDFFWFKKVFKDNIQTKIGASIQNKEVYSILSIKY